MPQPEPLAPQPSAEDSYLEVLAETLEGLEDSARGQFLRQFFRTIARIDLSDALANEYWERILIRRRELAESIGKKISLKTAMVDVLASTNFLRVPILMEYEEFKKLQINAATDPLTGLYNRRLFDEYCDKELNRAKRYGHQLAVVILDVHKLKEVNDRHGHLQGDQILQLAAATLRKTLRASDFAFRIGGDEFALLLPQTDTEQANTLCRRVRTQYEGDIHSLKLDPSVTLDFGIAVLPVDGEQKSELMGTADERLYLLKNAGRIASPLTPPTSTPAPESVRDDRSWRGQESSETREVPSSTGSAPSHGASVRSEHADRPVEPKPQSAGSSSGRPAKPTPISTSPLRDEKRKWERVSLVGTKAYAMLSETDKRTATVIDLSYGGVALVLEKGGELPNQFSAVLHVPILPPVRVILRQAYIQRLDGDRIRAGCSFVS
ncbi:MAG: GGDEF domain-containing protein [Candidatus Acidiferrales bacterium]|jgi:diguanylate cyclase (GGDEF)-like protein